MGFRGPHTGLGSNLGLPLARQRPSLLRYLTGSLDLKLIFQLQVCEYQGSREAPEVATGGCPGLRKLALSHLRTNKGRPLVGQLGQSPAQLRCRWWPSSSPHLGSHGISCPTGQTGYTSGPGGAERQKNRGPPIPPPPHTWAVALAQS